MGYFEDWLDRVTVDPVTGESIAAKKRRKKYNIPGPGDYAYYTGYPQPKGVPVWDLNQKPPKIPKSEGLDALKASGGRIAQGVMALQPQSLNMTLEELQTRSINLAHFAHTGKLAPPELVVGILQNPAVSGLSYEGYLAMFKGAEKLHRDIVHERDMKRWNNPDNHPTLQDLHPDVDVNYFDYDIPEQEENVMINGMALPPGQIPDRGNERLVAEQHAVPSSKVIADAKEVFSILRRRPKTTEELAILNNGEAFVLLQAITTRLKRRGAPIEYDPNNPYGDPDALMVVAQYAMGRSWADAVYGNGERQAMARDVFAYMRELPFSREAWDEMGRRLGVSQPDWHNGQTIEAVFDALLATENELSRGIIFDGWMFGRPVGQSASRARAEFANRFGKDRLPEDHLAIYEEETVTPMKIIEAVMGAPGRMQHHMEQQPYIGEIAAPIGWLAHNGMTLMMAPLMAVGDIGATAYELSLAAQPGLADRKIKNVDEYVRLVKAGIIGQDERTDKAKLYEMWKWNWGVFTDFSDVASKLEENWGRDPFTMAYEVAAVENLGYVPPWVTEAGQLSWFTAQFALGVKLDAAGRPVVRAGGRKVFQGAHAAEAALRARYFSRKYGIETTGTTAERFAQLRTALAGGPETLLYKSKAERLGEIVDNLDNLDAETRAAAEELLVEMAEITDRIEGRRYAKTAVTDPDRPVTADDLMNVLREKRLTSTEDYATDLSAAERRKLFKGTLPDKRNPGQPMDVVAMDLGMTADELFEFIAEYKPGTKGVALRSELTRLGEIADELDGMTKGKLGKTSVVEEGVSGQTAIAVEGERIIGDTQLGMGAIDEGAPGPAPKPKPLPEEMPGQTAIETPRGRPQPPKANTPEAWAQYDADLTGKTVYLVRDQGMVKSRTKPPGKGEGKLLGTYEPRPVEVAGAEVTGAEAYAAAVEYAAEYDRLTAAGKEPDFYNPPAEVLDFIEIRETESLAAYEKRLSDAGLNADGEPIGRPVEAEAGTAGVPPLAAEEIPMASDRLHPKTKGKKATPKQLAAAAKEDGLPAVGEKVYMERDARGGGTETVEVEVVGYEEITSSSGGSFAVGTNVRLRDLRTGELVDSGFVQTSFKARRAAPVEAPKYEIGDRVSDIVEDEHGIPRTVEGEVKAVYDEGATLLVDVDGREMLFNARTVKPAGAVEPQAPARNPEAADLGLTEVQAVEQQVAAGKPPETVFDGAGSTVEQWTEALGTERYKRLTKDKDIAERVERHRDNPASGLAQAINDGAYWNLKNAKTNLDAAKKSKKAERIAKAEASFEVAKADFIEASTLRGGKRGPVYDSRAEQLVPELFPEEVLTKEQVAAQDALDGAGVVLREKAKAAQKAGLKLDPYGKVIVEEGEKLTPAKAKAKTLSDAAYAKFHEALEHKLLVDERAAELPAEQTAPRSYGQIKEGSFEVDLTPEDAAFLEATATPAQKAATHTWKTGRNQDTLHVVDLDGDVYDFAIRKVGKDWYAHEASPGSESGWSVLRGAPPRKTKAAARQWLDEALKAEDEARVAPKPVTNIEPEIALGTRVRVTGKTSKGKEYEYYGTLRKVKDEGPNGVKSYVVDVEGAGVNGKSLEIEPAHTGQRIEAAAPVTKTEQGVKVQEVETPTGPVEVDVGAGDFPGHVQRLNDGGFPTYGSHAGGEGHPAGHPAKMVEPYVEFRVVDLGPANVRKGKMAAIERAAKKTGMALDKKSKTAEGRSLITVSGENIAEFVEALVPKAKPVTEFTPPRTVKAWAQQLDDATGNMLSPDKVERLAVLIAVDARYIGELPDIFVMQHLAGVVKGNNTLLIDGVLADAVGEGNALYTKAQKLAKGDPEKLPAAVEFYREKARTYLETHYPEMGDDIAAAVDYLTRINRETKSAVRRGEGKAFRWNTKTLFSIDISTICPFAEKPCAMCYNYQLEGLMNAKRSGKLEKGAPQSPAKAFESTPYNGEILEMPESLVTYLNETQNGLRVNSFGDWTPAVDKVFSEIVAHAQARGLKLKVITKQTKFIEKYGVKKGVKSDSVVTIQLSTDFDAGWIRRSLEMKGELTKNQEAILFMLENKGPAPMRGMLSQTMSLKDAAALKAKYQNVVIRYTAVNRAEAMLAVTDPRVSVLTLYHSPITDPVKLRIALEEMWGPRKGPKIDLLRRFEESKGPKVKPAVEVFGEANLQAFADLMKPFTPKQFLDDAVSGRPAKLARVQAELDAVYGKGVITVEEWARKAYDKICCQTGKCGTCPIQCSFGVRAVENADLLMAAVDGVPIASVQFLADGRALIRALNSPGVVELTHEVGHIFRRTMNAEDAKIARKWAGLKEGEPWTVAAEERFAEAFGEYFAEYVEKGILRRVEYEPLMRTFTRWLVDLWNRLRGKERHTSPEVRQVFDRLNEMVREVEETMPELMKDITQPPAGLKAPPVAPQAQPLYNAFFRTNAEVMAKVDDPAWIAQTYEIPDTNLAAKDIARAIAKETDPAKVEKLLAKLRDEHGVEIDGGAAAMIKNMRQRAYRTGFGKKNMLRFFITPSLYGKTHPIHAKTDASYNYMVASKMGKKKMTDADWALVRKFRKRIWEEDNPNKVQAIIRELDELIDENIKAEFGSLEPLEAYTRLYHRLQGRAIMTGGKVSYYGVGTAQAGTEGSFVTSPGKARATATKRLDDAKAELEKHIEDSKRVEELPDDMEVAGEAFEGAEVRKAKRMTKAEKYRLQRAVDEAEKEVYRVADAIDVVEALSGVEKLDKMQAKALAKAHDVLNDYTVPVPVKLGQRRAHIQFRHNPRILASYMAGPASRTLALTDQMIFQPLMTIFKETVMASLGFPIRVNIGDEFIRLIPEGTINRMRGKMLTRHPLERLEKSIGVDMTAIRAELHDKLAYDWVASDSGSWILVFKGTHPKYFEYLAADLRSWAEEPIVQRLIDRNGGVFPEKPGDIKTFIEELMAEETDLALEIRAFLEDTYRYGSSGIDKVAFDEWCGLWQDRMEAIASNRTLRQAMTAKTIDIAALKRVPDEYLWPVNAPEAAFVGSNANILNWAVKANPFHYVYNGIRVPFTESRRVGSVQVLGAMSNWMRETVFSDRYYLERNAELARSPHLAKTPEGLEELHQTAAARAMRHTNQVTYSRSSTMFEDMTRNLIPFGNAYRQFWMYWGATFAKHPFAITAYTQAYRELMPDQFMHWGDYQVFMPGVPFFAAVDEEAGEGVKGIIKSNLPQASFLVTGGARTLIGAMGGDPEDYSDVAMMAGLSGNMAPYSRQARLFYGVTGWADYDKIPMLSDTLVTLFGDPDKLRKATINALLGQLHYKEGELYRDKPWWWSFGFQLGAHPEALFAEMMKQMPNPATVTYSPADVAKKNDLMFKYFDAINKHDSAKAAQLRADEPWLDRYLSYHDASAEEQVAMKLDPKNKDMLKYWVSPYNYDTKGASFDGYDWQQQFTQGKVSWKKEAELEAQIHNLYVDIHGGTYVETDWRSAGIRYAGDAPRAEARKRTIAKIERALRWADKKARYLAKTQGWDYDRLIFQFENPDKDWGIWPSLLESEGLNKADYNIFAAANVYFDKYADQAYPTSKGALQAVKEDKYGKVKPQYLETTAALRALDLAKWIVDPKLEKQFLTETPYVNQLRKTKREQRDEVFKTIIESAASKQWYFIGSQTLNTVGIPASPKLDMLQLELNRQYNEAKKLKAGTSEYKAAMAAYWANRDKVLKSVKGGALIAGGVADRLIAIPFVLTPKVTSMGTGSMAVALQGRYEDFMRVVKRELAKEVPQSEKISEAWMRVDWNAYKDRQREELMRVAAWSFLLSEAKWRRNDMRTTYSEYYNAPMNSAASTYGQQHVKALNDMVAKLRRFSPAFDRELSTWFASDTNFGYRFLDWYKY